MIKNITFDISKIKFSRFDLERNIKLPEHMDEELAEEIGIHLGDGHLNIYETRHQYITQFTCNILEKDYYENHIPNLLRHLYNYRGIKVPQRDNSIIILIRSKAIALFKANVLQLPLGKKSNLLSIPSVIFQSNRFLPHFLRGLADTDFSLTFKKKYRDVHYYPVIRASFSSKELFNSLVEILNTLNTLKFTFHPQRNVKVILNGKSYTRDEIFISGKKNLKRWVNLVGFNNSKHLTKYQIWKKFGFCPPRTTLTQRFKILEGNIDPLELEPR